MDMDGFDFSEQMKQLTAKMQTQQAKKQADLLEAVDKQYALFDELSKDQLEALSVIFAGMASVDRGTTKMLAGYWNGYIRAQLAAKHGVNPNPYATSVSDEDLAALSHPEDEDL